MSRGLYDEDGIDGPFDRAMDAAMREDEAARARQVTNAIYGCPMCGDAVDSTESGSVFCGDTCRDSYDRFQEGGSQ